MATQTGIHPFVKKLGNVAGFKRKYNKKAEVFEKGKGGPSQFQYNTLPSMEINRENGNEFKTRTDLSLFFYNSIKGWLRYKKPFFRFNLCNQIHISQLGNSAPRGHRGNVLSFRGELPLRIVAGDIPFYNRFPVRFDAVWFSNGQGAFLNLADPFDGDLLKSSPNATHYRIFSVIMNINDTEWDLSTSSWVSSNALGNLPPVVNFGAWESFPTGLVPPFSISSSLFPFVPPSFCTSIIILCLQNAIYDGTNYNIIDNGVCASVVAQFSCI